MTRRVEVEPGVRIHVQEVGVGPPVVLLAGLGLQHESWDRQVRRLSAAGHRVLCIDLRGTGHSDKPAGSYAMDRIVEDVERVLEHLGADRPVVVGWSFGGQVAFRLAARGRRPLAAIALVGSNGVRASRSPEFPFGDDPDVVEASLVRAECDRRMASRRRFITYGFHRDPDPDLVEWLLRCQLQMPSWAMVACYSTYLRTDLLADLPAVRLPVLQLVGDHDPVTPPEAAPWVQERLADGRLVVLEDCGHYPMLEAPDAFDAALEGFLAEQLGARAAPT